MAVLLTAGCGSGEGDRESAAGSLSETSEAQAVAGAEGSWSADALCDALDVDAIAAMRGISIELVENIDRSMFEDKVGVCHLMQDNKVGSVRITVYAPSSARWVVNKGAGVKEPLEEQPLSETVTGIGDRAVYVWNTPERPSPQAAIYHLVVDYDDVTVNVGFQGVEVDRSPETFKAVAEQVRSDLGL